MRKIIFALISIVLFVIACSQEQTVQQPTAPADAQAPVAPQAPAAAEPTVNKGDPAVLKLFERNAQVKSYSFDVVRYPSNIATATYMVKGTKARVDPVDNVVVAKEDMDFIYLDMAARTANGYCERVSGCDDVNQAYSLAYKDFEIIMPQDWIEQIKYGQKAGSVTFGNKPVTRVKYEADGKYYEAYVDNYFGMPQRVAIATDPEMTNIVGGYEYRNMAFNNVKDTDVVHQTVTT